MTYQEALDYIYQTTWLGSKLGLERTKELLFKLGNPHKKLKYIHIAGTNGKGSTAAMLASILKEAGYTTGLNTSPYLYKFSERMQVNGVSISDKEVAELVEEIAEAVKSMEEKPTEFEIVTCLSFCYFVKKKCDIVVLEVGLGGRLDSTNIIETNEAAVITTIGLDHTEFLGDTLEKIAVEKAGIIKEKNNVIISGQKESIINKVMEICKAHSATLKIADSNEIKFNKVSLDGQQFDWKHMKNLMIPLLGEHQRKNTATVLETIEVLKQKGWNITDENIRNGLFHTVWPGRFEVLQKNPIFIVDGGHNPQCAETVVNTLSELFPKKKIIFLVGILADKDLRGILDLSTRLAKQFITVTPNNPRALESEKLKHLIEENYSNIDVISCNSIKQGIIEAKRIAASDDIICAFGSLYMIGEIRNCFGLY